MRRSPEDATAQLMRQFAEAETFSALVEVGNSRRQAAGALVSLVANTYLEAERPGANEYWEDFQDLTGWREYVEKTLVQGDFAGDPEILAGIGDGLRAAEEKASELFGYDIVYRVNS